MIARIIVSNDDLGILDVAAANGAETHHRIPATSSDTASSESVLLEVIEGAGLEGSADVIAMLQRTSPVPRPRGGRRRPRACAA